MATKAELEAELAELKLQMAQTETEKTEREAELPDDDTSADSLTAFEISDIAVKDLIKEIETFANKKPLISLLAAFMVGYVIGRAK